MIIHSKSLRLAAFAAASILALSVPAAASSSDALREIRCDLMEQNGGRLETVEAPDLHVLEQTASGRRFAPALTQDASGIMCGRTSIVPAPNDDQVLALGLPFYIAEMGTPGRLGVLEIDSGQYRFRMLAGRLRPEDQAALDARLAEFQGRIRAAAPAPSPAQ